MIRGVIIAEGDAEEARQFATKEEAEAFDSGLSLGSGYYSGSAYFLAEDEIDEAGIGVAARADARAMLSALGPTA